MKGVGVQSPMSGHKRNQLLLFIPAEYSWMPFEMVHEARKEWPMILTVQQELSAATEKFSHLLFSCVVVIEGPG